MIAILICLSTSIVTHEISGTTITYKGDGTLTIADGLFALGMKVIKVEEGITSIANEAFYQATQAINGTKTFQYTEVYLPCSLVSIGDLAFSGVDSQLEKVLFPTYQGSTDASHATEEELENFYALRTIGKGAFMNCHKFTKGNIPGTITSIEDFCFKGVQITGYYINSKVQKIGTGAFQDCESLKRIILSSSVNNIGAYAFGNCTSLTTVTWNDPKQCIFGGGCFENCKALTTFTFPKSASFEEPCGIFKDCSSLTTVTMPETLNDVNGIPSSTINMFENCEKLTSVTLPNNLEKIGMRMFMNTGIETLYLPKTVNFIDGEAFKDCTKLKYVNLSSTDPIDLGLNIFDNTPNLDLLAIHGNLKVDMGEDMFGGKRFCYYGTTNPLGSKLCLNPDTTTIYVTEEFKNKYDVFGSPVNSPAEQFVGYPYKVMEGNDCAFPGEEKVFPTPSPSPENETESEAPVEPSEVATTTEPINKEANGGEKKKKMSTGLIIGIVFACLAALALIALITWLILRKKKNNLDVKDATTSKKDSEISLKKTPSRKDYNSIENMKDEEVGNPNNDSKIMI